MNKGCEGIIVGERYIGRDSPAFIIAEIGCNFEGDIALAKEMIRKAAEAGADAVKFQTFVPQKLASRFAEKFWDIEGCPGETQIEEFLDMPQLTREEYILLKQEADRAGVIFFSTPSDEGSADLLESMDAPLYKISSMDITHYPLLRYVARKGKPVIISTGASTIGEIEGAMDVIRNEGNDQIILLHCISNYPTLDENVNLRMIHHMLEVFPHVLIGYSDHTLPEHGEGILVAAVVLGARIIEKHFTFDNRRLGYDHAISVNYEGLKRVVTQIRRVEKTLGEAYKRPVESELKARLHARRSLVAAVDIPKGSIVAREMIDIKRPGTGIEPRFLDIIIGRKTRRHIIADTALQWDMI